MTDDTNASDRLADVFDHCVLRDTDGTEYHFVVERPRFEKSAQLAQMLNDAIVEASEESEWGGPNSETDFTYADCTGGDG
jgi:hypothetical protein